MGGADLRNHSVRSGVCDEDLGRRDSRHEDACSIGARTLVVQHDGRDGTVEVALIAAILREMFGDRKPGHDEPSLEKVSSEPVALGSWAVDAMEAAPMVYIGVQSTAPTIGPPADTANREPRSR
jgi:hypothetical protein